MKVTKLIREYVEESVAKKFQPAFDELNAQDKRGQMKKEVELFQAEMGNAVRQTFKDKFGGWFETPYAIAQMESVGVSIPYSLLSGSYFTQSEEFAAKEKELFKKRNQAIKNILIELELGATKSELDHLLNAVEV